MAATKEDPPAANGTAPVDSASAASPAAAGAPAVGGGESATTAAAAPKQPAEAGSAAPAVAKGKKRAAPGEGQGDAKRKKTDFAVGDRGVFFTTNTPGGAANARKDLVRLLEMALSKEEPGQDKARPAVAGSAPEPTANSSAEPASGGAVPSTSSTAAPPADQEASKDGSSAAVRLEAELKQLAATKPAFVLCGSEVAKGTGFLKFAGDASGSDPTEVVVRVLESQRKEFEVTRMAPMSRLLCRVLPIDYTCKPFLEDFRKLAQEVLPRHVGPEAEPTVWALEFRARNTNTLKKEAVLAIIDEIVAKDRHKVNLSDPAKCILVEVNPLFCGLSILPSWAPLKKYNLHALTTPEEGKKAAPPPFPAAFPRAEASPVSALASAPGAEAAKATGPAAASEAASA